MAKGLLIFKDEAGATALFKEFAESVGFSPVICAGNFDEAIAIITDAAYSSSSRSCAAMDSACLSSCSLDFRTL